MFDVPERILIRFQDKCLYHYWKDSVVHVAYQFCLVMVLSLHGPLFSKFVHLNLIILIWRLAKKKPKIKFKFCQFADARKRQHFLMLEV